MNRLTTRFIAGKFSLLLLLLTILSCQEIKPQYLIDQYPGIPLIIYPERNSENLTGTNYSQLKEMGVFAVVAADVLDESYLTNFSDSNLYVLPQYAWGLPNPIWKYTNSHYTVWEAEGTDHKNGLATLSHSDNTIISPDGKSIIAEAGNVLPNEIIIDGPGYPQNITYNANYDFVDYTIDYRMKIIQTIPNLPPDYLNDEVCTLKITNRRDRTYAEDPIFLHSSRRFQ